MRLLLALMLVTGGSLSARAQVAYAVRLSPGAAVETQALAVDLGSMLRDGARTAEPGGGWAWRFTVPPGARCVLNVAAQGMLSIHVTGADGKPLQTRIQRDGEWWAIYATAPAAHPVGGMLRWTIRPAGEPIAVRTARLDVVLADSAGDGVSDFARKAMGLPAGRRASVGLRSDRPRTTFQVAEAYSPDIAVPADAVLVYSADPETIRSWAEKGYVVQAMGGFRESAEYARANPGEVQTDRQGRLIAVAGTYYMVPTLARLARLKEYYAAALAAGAAAVCPEEPEMWSRAGYSEAFRNEWRLRYAVPWVEPHTSIDARYRSEQLKAFLMRRSVETILAEALRTNPQATRMVALHSPVTYYHWGIPAPHHEILNLPSVSEVIGQVWTGTARTPARASGNRAERTFEVGYLEYSSLYHLVRGTNKRLWYLMDPLEDNLSRPIGDYQSDYHQTLLASLMFPPVDSYEVMPWPQRIYSRVPATYATVTNTIVGALTEMWRYGSATVEAGSPGIGVFTSDSMGWQRDDPSASDIEGFYALCLPLVNHGVPAQVLSLDRVAEPGYLEQQRVLVTSYDYLKPTAQAQNAALAEWTRRGGSLVVVGGGDAYDGLADAWWRKLGYASPLDDLLQQLGVRTARETRPAAANGTAVMAVQASAAGSVADLSNRRTYTLDLTRFAQDTGSVLVRVEDATPEDGAGATVFSGELRLGGRLAASFLAGSELESRFLVGDEGSLVSGRSRTADGAAAWVYRFDNLPRGTQVSLALDMGNTFRVKAGPGSDRGPVLEAAFAGVDPLLARVRLWQSYPLTLSAPPAGAAALWQLAGENRPVVWQAQVGRGTVIYAGVAPAQLSASALTSRWLRAIVRRAYEATGGAYRETEGFVLRRGPYTAVRTQGATRELSGRFVNLLSPTLAVVKDPEVDVHGVAFYRDLGPERGVPRVAAASGRLRARAEQAAVTGMLVSGPAGTVGAARLWGGSRRVASVAARTALGAKTAVTVHPNGDTVLLRYTNDPDGVAVRVNWK